MQPAVRKARLLIAEDHQLVADGMRKLLEPEFELAGVVNDGRAAVDLFDRLRPDLTLLDVGLPLLNGIEATRQIKKLSPDARILIVSMHSDHVYIEEAFNAGATGYLLKQSAAGELVEAIHSVLQGRYYVSKRLAPGGAPSAGDSIRNPALSFSSRLTQRQREVLQLIAEGKSMKEMGTILGISVRTVEFHKNGIMRELGLRTTAELTRYALAHGIAVLERDATPAP